MGRVRKIERERERGREEDTLSMPPTILGTTAAHSVDRGREGRRGRGGEVLNLSPSKCLRRHSLDTV